MLMYFIISWCAGMSARSLELAKVGHYSRHEAAQEAAMAAAQVIKVKPLLSSLGWRLHQARVLTQVAKSLDYGAYQSGGYLKLSGLYNNLWSWHKRLVAHSFISLISPGTLLSWSVTSNRRLATVMTQTYLSMTSHREPRHMQG